MKYLASFLLLFTIGCATSIRTVSSNKQIRIAIIDTGFDLTDTRIPLCTSGHKDLTNTGIIDKHGHGTNIVGTIHSYASTTSHCFIIIKYYHITSEDAVTSVNRSVEAFKAAIEAKADIINYSGGGAGSSIKERKEVIKALNEGIKIVAAAGNSASDLDINPYYPANYDKRIIVVSSYTTDLFGRRVRPKFSNYGSSVDLLDMHNSTTICPKPNIYKTCSMSGTSQATAIVTGKLVRCYSNRNSYSEVCKFLD